MAKVAFMQLGSCWGCNQSLLDSSLSLLHVLPELDVVFWPAVVDFKYKDLKNYPDGSIDAGFLEGFCRTEDDIEHVHLMRKKCKIIVAIGSCAVIGGVPGLANLYTLEELTKRKFLDTSYIDDKPRIPSHHVPKILEAIPDLHRITHVDVDLVGCPPRPGNIVGLIATVLGQVDTKRDIQKNMCQICPLSECLLKQGVICYGSITAAGDPVGKLAQGYPVLGEFGFTQKVHAENAALLLEKVAAKPMAQEEVHQAVEMLIMTLGSTPLKYLTTKQDPVRRLKLSPDTLSLKKVVHPTNLDKTIEVVDFKAEGFPQILNDILGAVMADLRMNPLYDDKANTVCTACDRNVENKEVSRYIRDYVGLPDQKKCMLLQGYVCMGPITRSGCGARCLLANSPCLGCYGPALNVDDYGTKAMSYFPSICTDSPENIRKFFSDPAGLFNRFCVPTSLIGHKLKEYQKK